MKRKLNNYSANGNCHNNSQTQNEESIIVTEGETDDAVKKANQNDNNADNDEMKSNNKESLSLSHQLNLQLTRYVVALRPWSFTASFTPVALGCTLAYKTTGDFHPAIFIYSLITALSVHAAGNLVNTYFDYFHGIDSKKSDDRTLVDKILSPQDVAWLGGVLYVIGCLGFLCLTFVSPAKMEHLALIYFGGLSGSFLYTGGLGLKYIALGDLLIFLTFGPVTIMFSFLCQTGRLSLICILYAIPLALNTEAILHSNNTRDMDCDSKAGIVTLAILLGHTGSYLLFTLLIFTPYIIFILMALHYTKWMFIPASSMFLAFRYEKDFRRGDLKNLPRELAKLNLLMGLLYVVACLCADSNNLPKLL
ncbi:ubiA prenyltransferase domain-containing protein 1 [Patella vulgata]|uniref:ubiA prenyltransferase domain-containing protein 1 n=1 Tax=Patella vulgata TaxID=6465 RepID=UPI00217F87E6|nr:ubiA prenyltransferase domain-containing protein 1 [Patella vulgata]